MSAGYEVPDGPPEGLVPPPHTGPCPQVQPQVWTQLPETDTGAENHDHPMLPTCPQHLQGQDKIFHSVH